ncbi:MAG: lipid A biosynthesis acyltransferase [Saprospiraceae bacterium]|nr:lipid A biosynthesis acyltransferase [Saprospiraceae bacterium]
MASWEGKSKGTPTGYKIFVWILRRFGIRPAYWLLRVVAFYYFLSSWKTSRAILQLYRQGLGMGLGAALVLLYQNYYRLGQTLIDKVAVMAGLGSHFQNQSQGLEHLETIAAGQQGGILLSAHMGNWEIAGHMLKKLNRKINLVMYDGEHQAIKQYLNSVTGNKSFNIIVISPDNSHIFKIASALGNNELICMHADRYVAGAKTISTAFLGRPAKFPEGPFLLGAKLRAPVSFVYALKTSDTVYSFSASPPKEIYLDADNTPQHLLREFVAELEAKVRAHPEQWFNYFPFWDHN